MNIVLWIAAALLAAMFLMAGSMKALQPKEKLLGMMKWAENWSPSQLKALGAVEVLGAIGLVLPRATGVAPVLTPLAAAGCAVVMAGAVAVHARMKDYPGTGMPAVLLALALVVAIGRF